MLKGHPDLFLWNSLLLGNREDENICVYDSYHDFVVLFSGMENMQQNTRVCFLMVAWLKIFETVS